MAGRKPQPRKMAAKKTTKRAKLTAEDRAYLKDLESSMEFRRNLQKLLSDAALAGSFSRLLLDQKEDRLFHAKDETWWWRDLEFEKTRPFYAPALRRAEPPEFVRKLQAENERLKKEVAELKKLSRKK